MNNAYSAEGANDQRQERAKAVAEISRVAATTVAVSSAIIGCWAVACFISGVISGGSASGVVSGLIQAIVG